jgi:replicative DNA helicase
MSDETPKPITYRPEQLLAEGKALAKEAHDARQRGAVNGPAISSFPNLSNELCRSFCVGLHGLLGEPGSGKSAFATHLAEESEVPSLLVCLEMPPLEYLIRSAARRSSTYISKFRDGALDPEEWEKLVKQAAEALPHLRYLDGTRVTVRIHDIQESFEKMRDEHKYGLIVVDSVSAWAGSMGGNLPENDRVSEALRALQRLAEELKIAILCVGEQNRMTRNSDSQMTGKGSSVWEYGTWSQLVLQKQGKADAKGNRDILLTITKNRRGREGFEIPLWFEGGFMRFSERSEADAKQSNPGESDSYPLPPGRSRSKSPKLTHSAKVHNGKTAT